jgi:hypothetical protein
MRVVSIGAISEEVRAGGLAMCVIRESRQEAIR